MPTPRAHVVHRQPFRVDDQLAAAVTDEGVITLAGGVPADDLFPEQTMAAAMRRTVDEDGKGALQYGWPIGLDRLREWIVAWMGERGVTLAEDQVLVTSGAQQGLCLLGALLVPEKSAVAVETPTYVAALQALDLRKPKLVGVPRTTAGLDLDALAVASKDAKVLYLVASGHNPTGGVLSAKERASVLEIAEAAGAWVIDDDAYGEMQLGGYVPPLRSFDRHLDRVVHLGSFSKVLAPGLRVGSIAGSTELIRQATLVKQAQDLETATLTQRVLMHWLEDNDLEQHIGRCLSVYRSRRDALVTALQPLADLASWEVPQAGFSLLFRPNEPVSLADAIRAGVAFEPAAPYFADGSGRRAMRLSFSNVSAEDLGEAVRRLASVMRK